MAATSIATSFLRRAVATPLRLRSRAPLPTSSSRTYVVVPRAVAKQASKASVSVSTKGARFSSSRITAADESLKSVIDSEIEYVVQSDYYKEMKKNDVPETFPFEIIDKPGDQSIILKRELNGEIIKATIFADYEEPIDEFSGEEEEDEAEGEEGNKGEEGEEEEGGEDGKQNLTVVVNVQKGEGPFLEIVCQFDEEGYEIQRMMIRKEGDDSMDENVYQGPEFSDLDEGLQEAVRRYLEVRGIRHSLFKFLTKYMIAKEDREYLGWLKNMKSFMSK